MYRQNIFKEGEKTLALVEGAISSLMTVKIYGEQKKDELDNL
jgi:hypothetical protein